MSGFLQFSWRRLAAIVIKESIQTLRDRLTLSLMVGIPIIQLTIFGFAINTNPKHLPTAVVGSDLSPYSRAVISAMTTSGYFQFERGIVSESEAQQLLRRGQVQFIVTFPENFSRELVKGHRPELLLEADAADPAAVAYASAAFEPVVLRALQRDLRPAPNDELAAASPVDIRIHRCFNPEIRTEINIVPALLGVILTMTMVIINALAMTREKERGTMENLLSTPVRPLEVMLGKIIPYIVIGYTQILLVLLLAKYVFGITPAGSVWLLMVVSLFFAAANLAVGLTISTVARNQIQAGQMSFFFFLPSLLLSGFMFPFRGMPDWAQWLGNLLPLTHYIHIARGIVLRGAGTIDIAGHLTAIVVFTVVMITVGLFKYRQTLD